MKSVSCFTTGCATAAFVVAFAVTSSTTPLPPTPQQAAPSLDLGASLFARMCSDCHDSKRVVSRRRTSAEWEDVLRNMIDEGAEGTAKEFEQVFDYLVRSFGRVYINTAKASEIRSVLGVSAEQADALVAYRTANGPFADPAAVKKVPGIEAKVIDDQADALAF